MDALGFDNLLRQRPADGDYSMVQAVPRVTPVIGSEIATRRSLDSDRSRAQQIGREHRILAPSRKFAFFRVACGIPQAQDRSRYDAAQCSGHVSPVAEPPVGPEQFTGIPEQVQLLMEKAGARPRF